jgi:hypothetical protein
MVQLEVDGQAGTAKIAYTVEVAISACKAAEKTGTYLKRGEPGRLVVRDKLSSTLKGSQQQQSQANPRRSTSG